jgi:predicted dehydrogenase
MSPRFVHQGHDDNGGGHGVAGNGNGNGSHANGNGHNGSHGNGNGNGSHANGNGHNGSHANGHGGGSRPPIKAALVGYGYWGPNLARNLVERPEFELAMLCEQDPIRAVAFTDRYRGIPVCGSYEQVLADPAIDAVVVATPPSSHYELVRRALDVGKHVLVEKPLATAPVDAQHLVAIAEASELVLMPGHTFVYSPSVMAIRDLIGEGVLGEIHFVTSSRMNLGKYQKDGVICDLAPHDLSILLFWLQAPVTRVSATALSVFREGIPETAFLALGFGCGAAANVQISWLAPRKLRQMIVVGSRKMVVYDDTNSDEPVRLYDRGMDYTPPPANFGEYQLTYRSGDVVIPKIDAAEPLAAELVDFARAIRTGIEPRSNAALGVEVVRVLDGAQQSLRRCGEPIELALAGMEM